MNSVYDTDVKVKREFNFVVSVFSKGKTGLISARILVRRKDTQLIK